MWSLLMSNGEVLVNTIDQIRFVTVSDLMHSTLDDLYVNTAPAVFWRSSMDM